MEFRNFIFTTLVGQPSCTSVAKVKVIYQKPNQNNDPAQKWFLFAQSRAPDPFTSPVVESSRPTGTTQFWWDNNISFTVPVTTNYDLGQPELIDVIKCHCKARKKKCSTYACGCWKDHISCTPYCSCAWDEKCHKPYTNRLHGVIAEGVTNMNDADGDYHADLDIKTLQIVFLTSFVLFWCSEIETSIVNGFYNPPPPPPPQTIFVKYYTWFRVKIHFS